MIKQASKDAATALFRQEAYDRKNTTVVIKGDRAIMFVFGIETAYLGTNPPALKIRTGGNFKKVVLDRLNGVLFRAGHELLQHKDHNWVFESSGAKFGDGEDWRRVQL